ncbi:MAG TPA: hypothetical protein PKK06_15455 [Phycisphaerae bacterium]|nr:hypothetical protein [Phycisphaerae bacterium]HNU46712.1 hypothetical protein [Phycisphaerae bacterium]
MNTYLLDAHVYTYFVDPAQRWTDLVSSLRTSVKRGRARVLGSVNLLEEFAGWCVRDGDAYRRGLEVFWDLCGKYILLPWAELLPREIRKGKRLSLLEACLDEETVRSARAVCASAEAHAEVRQGLRQQKEQYERDFTSAAGEFEREAQRQWSNAQVRENMAQMAIDEACVDDWYRGAMEKWLARDLGLSADPAQWPKVSEIPCTRHFFAVHLAMLRRGHQDKRKHKGSDLCDMEHYVHAAFADTFVTCDKSLRATLGLIECTSVDIVDMEQLRLRLRQEHLQGT